MHQVRGTLVFNRNLGDSIVDSVSLYLKRQADSVDESCSARRSKLLCRRELLMGRGLPAGEDVTHESTRLARRDSLKYSLAEVIGCDALLSDCQ